MSYKLQVIDQKQEFAFVPIEDDVAESIKAGPTGLFHAIESIVGQVLEKAGVELEPPLIFSLQHYVPVAELPDYTMQHYILEPDQPE